MEAQRPRIKLPDEYDGEADFLQEFRTTFGDNSGADWNNQVAGVEDLNFLIGNQWDADVQAQREAALKPTLTLNRLPAFVGQVVGRRKQNETQVRIVADTGGTEDAAAVREDLLRSVQRNAQASLAYDNAFLGSVTCGIGNFQVIPEYESNDVFEQKLSVKPILDHYAVVWDRMMTNPTGKDAKVVDVVDTITWKEFTKKWPWATPADVAVNQFSNVNTQMPWFTHNDVRIVNNWRMRYKKAVLAMIDTGAVIDITDVDDPRIISRIAQRPDGSPYIREVMKPYAQRYLVTALDVLEGPYELPIERVPVFRVPGWEIRISNVNYRWGLIRFLKDPQRLHNYWRSVTAEKIMRSPRATWLAASTAVAGREQAWRQSALTDDPLLVWNAESGSKPERVDPIQVEGALIEQSGVTTQDLKDISNMHEANLGMPSNEVSGRGIDARVAISETGTAIYEDNLSNAIEEAGRVMNDLLPLIYDNARVVKVVGEDSKERMQAINDMTDPQSVDITIGKYGVTAVTGRTYETKRENSADAMAKLANAMPQVLGVAADLIVEAQDWPGADKIARRLRRSMPPQILDPSELSPEQQQQMQATAAAGQQADAITTAEKSAAIQETQSAAALNMSRAQNYAVEAQLRPGAQQIDAVRTASEAASRELGDHLKAIQVGTHAG